jgi:hypothetical protein
LRICFVSGSRVPIAFFVERGAAMIVAPTIVPARSIGLLFANRSFTASEITSVSACFSSR